jgi:putative hydrolase of the HAD superfamily
MFFHAILTPMPKPFVVIAFDADDTLWDNEHLYLRAEQHLQQLLLPYCPPEQTAAILHRIDIANLPDFGYGIKAYTLSMVETALEASQGRITAAELSQVVDLAREMLHAPVELLPWAQECVQALAQTHSLMLITKGDAHDQASKLARSGLQEYFSQVEIVADKTQAVYADILKRHRLPAERLLMVGNSLRSDILPVIELGGQAVYVPYWNTWAHENTPPEAHHQDRFHEIEHLGQLEELVIQLEGE